jgi:hypothetical protein
MKVRLVLLLAIGCSTGSTPRSALSKNRPLPLSKGRILVTRDCASAPPAPKVEEDAPAVIDATKLDDITVSLVARKEELLLTVAGKRGARAAPTRTHGLYRGSNVEGKYPATSPEDGVFLSVFLPEGGPSNTQLRVRLNRCSIEVLRAERDDIGTEAPWFVSARVSLSPGRSVWAV